MEHFTITFQPDSIIISIHKGATILETAWQAGIMLNAVCGGIGTCGKCVVTIEDTGQQVKACDYFVDRDLVVIVEKNSRLFEQRILQQGIDRQIEIAPGIAETNPDLLQTPNSVFGIAVDVGTSTVVAKLIDMYNGKCVATAAMSNPQIKYGDDVIGRIAFGQTDDGLEKLNKAIVDCLNDLIRQLREKADIESSAIHEVTVAGNTTMSHILLKFSVKQLGQIPYRAHSVEAQNIGARQAGLDINHGGMLHTIENIAGFVGSDTTAVAVAIGFDEIEKMTLMVDIGTNGEIVLGNSDKLYAASCAAGPALEGARISQGSRAIEGAIERVILKEDDIDLDIIGDAPARTICGSGLIDAVAVLLETGLLDATGKLAGPSSAPGSVPDEIASRLIEKDGQPAFVLACNKSNANEPVILTQKDIRETQLAKAAIRAGMKLLQEKLNIKDSDIEQVLLAGAFGNYIQRDSAKRIGLLPDVDIEKIHFIGNAASTGAEMVLLSTEARKKAKLLSEKIEFVELASRPNFQDVFADCLMF